MHSYFVVLLIQTIHLTTWEIGIQLFKNRDSLEMLGFELKKIRLSDSELIEAMIFERGEDLIGLESPLVDDRLIK